MFYLINLLVAAVLAFLGNIMTAFAFIYVLYLAAMIIPGFAVTIRRIHDINKSALWFLIVFIPFIGPFILLYMMCTPGIQGDNDFGTDLQLDIV